MPSVRFKALGGRFCVHILVDADHAQSFKTNGDAPKLLVHANGRNHGVHGDVVARKLMRMCETGEEAMILECWGH